jgi:hypothetical protein
VRGQKVIPRPSADYFVVGRRQKSVYSRLILSKKCENSVRSKKSTAKKNQSIY